MQQIYEDNCYFNNSAYSFYINFQCNPTEACLTENNTEEESIPGAQRDTGLVALIQEADDFAQLVRIFKL